MKPSIVGDLRLYRSLVTDGFVSVPVAVVDRAIAVLCSIPANATAEDEIILHSTTPTQYAIYQVLCAANGTPVPLSKLVAGVGVPMTRNCVMVHIHRLRAALESSSMSVETVRGRGYYLARKV